MNVPCTRVQRRPVHGVLLLDKPLGFSSNDALQKAKWLLRAEKAGHTGTLDPLATGVLPLCFGAATKFSQLHLDADKEYEALARLGVTTTTGDAEGDVLQTREVALEAVRLGVELVKQRFTGTILQTPPMYSALKKDGKALYEYARAGGTVEREARKVTIYALDLRLEAAKPDAGVWQVRMRVRCSKGTYIRTLAEDIGEALGCGAHLTFLRRVQTGAFTEAQSISLAELEALPEALRMQKLLAVDVLLADFERIELSPHDAGRFLSGLRRRGAWPDAESVAVYATAPRALLGVGHVKAQELIPSRLLNPQEIAQIIEN